MSSGRPQRKLLMRQRGWVAFHFASSGWAFIKHAIGVICSENNRFCSWQIAGLVSRQAIKTSAIIPIFGFDDWEYSRLGEILI